MISVSNICDSLGRREIAHRLGVKTTAVSNAVVAERFPARWFVVIKSMCDEADLPCPEHLFTFVRSGAAARKGAA